MRVSIITINLNNRDGLKRTIDSVLSQTFRDFEWIIIDGGSTDGSLELIEQYANHFDYWVSEPDKGIYNAMNKGIKVAKGEYLQFLNSGDGLCNETALERSFAHNFSADIVYGNLYTTIEDKILNNYYQPNRLTFKMLLNDTILHSPSFIKRELFATEQYDESLRIVSDWKFFLKQALLNRSFEHIEEFVTFFDTTGISATNKELDKLEREKVIREEVSNLILTDYNEMYEMEKKLNTVLNDVRVKKVIRYSSKSAFYRKIITAFLSLVGLIDKFFSRSKK